MTTGLEFKWTTSRGRDTYGYNICSLYVNGRRVAACNGGGYDMKGTSLGNWIASAYVERLLALKPEQMEKQSHWDSDHRRVCAGQCMRTYETALMEAIKEDGGEAFEKSVEMPLLPRDCFECPDCKGETRSGPDMGKRIDDGRYFYGLTFHDPNYDPGKAVIGQDCHDRTLSDKEGDGMTVADAEAKGISLGLERYQAIYTASSKIPTERHTIPSIDGGCGFSSVERIMKAIGLTLEWVPGRRNRRDDIYILRDAKDEAERAA